jgi:uncharacterized membrane protein
MNSTLVQDQPVLRGAVRHSRWRLAGRLRKTILMFHIVAGGSWFGLDVAMAVLVFTAIGTDSAAVRAHTLQSLQLITVWPMFSAAMLSLITGIQLGLGSKYGLVRYWWVVIKLVLNLILAALVVTALRGEVASAANLGAQLAGGADVEWNFTNMIYPPIVSPTALTIAFLLAVFKPWGRIRRNRST